jgi:hypothetical protein
MTPDRVTPQSGDTMAGWQRVIGPSAANCRTRREFHYQDTELVSPVLNFSADPGPATVAVLLPQAAGHSDVRVRFGYTGQWSQYWEIDNVSVGQRACTHQAGALVTGRVAGTTGSAINGATVASVSDPSQTAATVATPGNGSINGGLYWLFVTGAGSQKFTASDTGYTPATKTAAITTGQVTTLNFTLAAASTSPGLGQQPGRRSPAG